MFLRRNHELTALPAVAMQANVKQSERMTPFDTDTQWIGVDNRCSGCISHIKSDFVVMITCYSRIAMPMQVFVLYGIMKKT